MIVFLSTNPLNSRYLKRYCKDMKVVPFLLRLYLGCFSMQHHAQETSPIQVFSPKETSTGNQNWMIDQFSDGTLVFANNQGLAYNATKWKLYPAKDNSIIRSVKAIEKHIYRVAIWILAIGRKDSRRITIHLSKPNNSILKYWRMNNSGLLYLRTTTYFFSP